MSEATRLELKASRELVAGAINILRRSERGHRTLVKLHDLLTTEGAGLDSGGQNAVRILIGETFDGNRAWLTDTIFYNLPDK